MDYKKLLDQGIPEDVIQHLEESRGGESVLFSIAEFVGFQFKIVVDEVCGSFSVGAFRESELIGYCQLVHPDANHLAWQVSPQCQKKGIGRKLRDIVESVIGELDSERAQVKTYIIAMVKRGYYPTRKILDPDIEDVTTDLDWHDLVRDLKEHPGDKLPYYVLLIKDETKAKEFLQQYG